MVILILLLQNIYKFLCFMCQHISSQNIYIHNDIMRTHFLLQNIKHL